MILRPTRSSGISAHVHHVHAEDARATATSGWVGVNGPDSGAVRIAAPMRHLLILPVDGGAFFPFLGAVFFSSNLFFSPSGEEGL